MKDKKVLIQSLKQKLKNISVKRHIALERVFMLYAHERFLERLSRSEYKENFILKGGLFLFVYNDFAGRPTRDIDLLAQHTKLDEERLRNIILKLCNDDEMILEFSRDSIKVDKIQKSEEYDGFRIRFIFLLERTRIPFQLDICMGDIVTPKPVEMSYPSLFDDEFKILAYTKETVFAEKLEAVLSLYPYNSRYKDYFDMFTLANNNEVDAKVLKEAICTTFQKRGTDFKNYNAVFCQKFAEDIERQKLWKNFIRESELPDIGFLTVIKVLKDYLDPITLNFKI